MILQLFVIFSYTAAFISGINKDTLFISIVVSFLAVCLGMLHLLKGGNEIKFPKYFSLMLLFTAILQLYLLFVSDKINPFYYAVIMGEGALYWLIFYNLRKGSEILKSLLIWLSIAYSSLYLLSEALNVNLIKLAELFFQSGAIPRHYHMGDLWAFTLVALIGVKWGKARPSTWLMVGLGIFFLAVSNTRSAFLSLAVGIGYLFTKQAGFSKLQRMIIVSLFALITGMFIFSSLGKTTLFDRPYFFQSVESFITYPLGIGMGNFKQIAEIYRLKDSYNAPVSIYTHNIFLEALSGIGVFSVVFLILLIYLVRDILKKNTGNVVWGAVAIAILTNFMFDTSYAIPGLVWILFMSLGLFQSREGNK